jgi:hypothetical protein
MSLYDNPKTSDYTELNSRLIILEEMFKIFMTENNTTLDVMQNIINELKSNESDSSNTPVISNTLNTYTNPCTDDNLGNNVLFQYYYTRVEVCANQEDDNLFGLRLFNIDKNDFEYI